MWKASDEAVLEVAQDLKLQHATALQGNVSYCPRCGQRPDGDRRFEEARELLFSKIPINTVRRVDADFCLAFAYWRRKVI